MNTEWWVAADAARLPRGLRAAEALVATIEAALSRFRADSALTRLNERGRAVDATLATVTRHALAMRAATAGAFEPGVGQALIDAGYRESFERLGVDESCAPAATPAEPLATIATVRVDGDAVTLSSGGRLDLGGIAKGWAVDQVAGWLEGAGAESYIVDGGGDIRVRGADASGRPWPIGVAGDRVVRVACGAVCTSSTRHRRWRTEGGAAHHIIDASTARPAAHAIEEAVVVARDASTADALATAVLASPARGLAAVEDLGAAALVCESDGVWRMTAGMTRYLG